MTQIPTRIAAVADRLDSLGVDALLVSDEINVRYLSGFTGDSSWLLIDPANTVILSDGRYETQISEQCPGLSVAIRPPHQQLPSLLTEVVGDLPHRRIGIEAAKVTLAGFRVLRDALPAVEWVETTGVVEGQRMIKDAAEIAVTREAVRVAEAAFRTVVASLTPESRERGIAHQLEAEMRALGAEGTSFQPIIAAGPGGALPHYHPEDKAIGESASLLIDWGACCDGYASDLTRTLHRPHVSDRFRRAYEAVREAQQAAIDTIRPGVSGREVDEAARGVLRREGLEEAFKHGLGHGTGLEIHESPRMSTVCEETLRSGMIVTVEPGVYFEGDFGVRIEDDILVTENGREVLSSLPKGLEDCRFML